MKRARGRPVTKKICIGCKSQLTGAAAIRAHCCKGLEELLEAKSTHHIPADDNEEDEALKLTKQRAGDQPAAIVTLNQLAAMEDSNDPSYQPSLSRLSITGISVVEESFFGLGPAGPAAIAVKASLPKHSTPTKLTLLSIPNRKNCSRPTNDENQRPVDENQRQNDENQRQNDEIHDDNLVGCLLPKRKRQKITQPRKLFIEQLAPVIEAATGVTDEVDFDKVTVAKSQKGADHLCFQGLRYRLQYKAKRNVTWRCVVSGCNGTMKNCE